LSIFIKTEIYNLMNYMNDSNLQKFDGLYQFLDDIKNQSSLEGIIFAHRDGGLIIENLENFIAKLSLRFQQYLQDVYDI